MEKKFVVYCETRFFSIEGKKKTRKEIMCLPTSWDKCVEAIKTLIKSEEGFGAYCESYSTWHSEHYHFANVIMTNYLHRANVRYIQYRIVKVD